MSEEKPSREQVLQRVNELLDVLKAISQDLADIAKSLKTVEAPEAVPTPAPPPSEAKKRSIADVRTLFPKDLEDMLLFEEREEYIVIKPRQYLGSENFAKIASIVRDQGGEYISAGKESHFRVSREIK
jgi:Asp-tRNA(Asn)/Glu-tRNA(Gln) amidotransferase A subunit family amidase